MVQMAVDLPKRKILMSTSNPLTHCPPVYELDFARTWDATCNRFISNHTFTLRDSYAKSEASNPSPRSTWIGDYYSVRNTTESAPADATRKSRP